VRQWISNNCKHMIFRILFPRFKQFKLNCAGHLRKCQRAPFLYITQLTLSVAFISSLQAQTEDSLSQIELKMREFDSIRRIILTISKSVDTTNEQIIPKLNSNRDVGEFEIILGPIDTSVYSWKTLHQEEGAYPIRLVTEISDSQTVIIRGKTIPFENIVGYNIIGENQFIFDVYKDLPSETDFSEKTINIDGEHKDLKTGKQISESVESAFDTTNSGIGSVQKNSGKGHFKMALSISVFIVLLGLAIISIVIFAPNISTLVKWFSKRKSSEISSKLAEEDKKSNDRFNLYEKESAIRKLMKESGTSYDEANILINISKKRFNVKV